MELLRLVQRCPGNLKTGRGKSWRLPAFCVLSCVLHGTLAYEEIGKLVLLPADSGGERVESFCCEFPGRAAF